VAVDLRDGKAVLGSELAGRATARAQSARGPGLLVSLVLNNLRTSLQGER
jgi:hypothetical protein